VGRQGDYALLGQQKSVRGYAIEERHQLELEEMRGLLLIYDQNLLNDPISGDSTEFVEKSNENRLNM
jgi:hypothetical protein